MEKRVKANGEMLMFPHVLHKHRSGGRCYISHVVMDESFQY